MISPGSAPETTSEAMADAVARLERCFETIHSQRMHDIPILNDALQVRALGFRRWQDFWLGALVTPWFINLIMLPTSENNAAMPTVGSRLSLGFPAGNFSFIAAHEDAIGAYLACSLLSPVLELHTQQMAEETAHEALLAIMKSSHHDAAAEPVAQTSTTPTEDAASLHTPLRRELFRRLLVADTTGSGDRK